MADWSCDVNVPMYFPEGKRTPSLTVSETGVLAKTSHEMVWRRRRIAFVVSNILVMSDE